MSKEASNAEAADIELSADEDRLLTDTAGRFTPITGPSAMLDLDLGPRQQPLGQPGARHVDFDRLDPTRPPRRGLLGVMGRRGTDKQGPPRIAAQHAGKGTQLAGRNPGRDCATG